jgi:ATP-dependent Lon protease
MIKKTLPHIILSSPIFKDYAIDIVLDKSFGEEVYLSSQNDYENLIFVSFQDALSLKENVLGFICKIESYHESTYKNKEEQARLQILPIQRAIYSSKDLVKGTRISLAKGIVPNNVNFNKDSDSLDMTKELHTGFKSFWENLGGTFSREYKTPEETVNTIGYLLSTLGSEGSDEYMSFSEELYFSDTSSEIYDIGSRLLEYLDSLSQESFDREVSKEINSKVMQAMTEDQRVYTLRKQLEIQTVLLTNLKRKFLKKSIQKK